MREKWTRYWLGLPLNRNVSVFNRVLLKLTLAASIVLSGGTFCYTIGAEEMVYEPVGPPKELVKIVKRENITLSDEITNPRNPKGLLSIAQI